MKKFEVISSNPSNEGKTFVTKLQREIEVNDEFFGTKKKKETYYVSGSKQLEVGTEIPAKHIEDNFTVKEYPYILEEGENAGEEIMLKWLHLK